tara:strand:+ start:337 stop:1056 length:720 start_codon:yes stop_codon:yes gene_type:complete
MTLPIINTPEYRLNVPSTDEEITYRPFLVKEEKLLLIAQETGTEDATYRAIKTIIENCCKGKIELDKLPLFDMEYIFLNIRAKSVGEIAKLKVTCPDDKKTQVDIEVDLTKVNVEMDETHDARIQLSEEPNIGILMMYPSIDTIGHATQSKGNKKDADRLFEMIANSLYQIWQGEETFDAMDYTMKDKMTFLESLSHQQFEKVQKFFETMPSLKHEVEITNPKTGVKSTITLSGMNDFF